jgi:Transposase DDE domain
MKENTSMELTHSINKLMERDLSGIFYDYYPSELAEKHKKPNLRDRVFNQSNTLLTMINSMVQPDKSLQNSVNIYKVVHNKNIKRLSQKEEEFRKSEDQKENRGKGRPRKRLIKIQKSKTQEISLNTSAYAQARQRLSLDLVSEVYQKSTQIEETKHISRFYGQEVYLTDGTYLQLQDTKEINEIYYNSSKKGYPRGLLSVIIQQGTGLVTDFELDSDKKSELELLVRMIENMKSGSLLLADDLYNCFAIFVLLKSKGVDIIVPGKRVRIYTSIKKIAKGDELVKIIGSSDNSKLYKQLKIKDKQITMRRIELTNPNNQKEKIVIFTSLLDSKISKEEIVLKYKSRWDIEINIREIKTILDMNIVRSKTPDMVMKEITSGFIAYNYIRRIIMKSAEESDFSPERDIFQKFYKNNTPLLVDKLGRVYSHWSPGRYGWSNK